MPRSTMMPALDDEAVRDLLARPPWAHVTCGCAVLKRDYCRSCDEFYWLHLPGCPARATNDKNHDGHRLTIVPYVEDRLRGGN
jgi:hypothetical protein